MARGHWCTVPEFLATVGKALESDPDWGAGRKRCMDEHLCTVTLGDGYVAFEVRVLRGRGEWKGIGPGPLAPAPGPGLGSSLREANRP